MLKYCDESNCAGLVLRYGWCSKHYQNWSNNGGPGIVTKTRTGGKCGHPNYYCYHSMLARCYNKNKKEYKHYGQRGIKVCNRWRGVDGFINFVVDMGIKPFSDFSLDRIDNDGNYEPSNCRWANQTTQVNNARVRRDNTSGFKGVYPNQGSWCASINIDGKRYFLGRFKDKSKAIEARLKAQGSFLSTT